MQAFTEQFPGRVVHSKSYRKPHIYSSKKILIVGNSASGRDLSNDLLSRAQLPIYQSIRSKSRWDGNEPPAGIEWKPIVTEYLPSGRIIFEDGTYLDDIDTVIYCTGYKASFPFWNEKANGRPMWDYRSDRIIKGYWHTYFQDFKSLGIVGLPRVLTFRSFEYQAIALARLFSGRNSLALPPLDEQVRWEKERAERTSKERKKFHDVPWDNGETFEWLGGLFSLAGLGTLKGEGRIPPVLDKDLVWAIENVRKYPEPGKDKAEEQGGHGTSVLSLGFEEAGGNWVLVENRHDDLLSFI